MQMGGNALFCAMGARVWARPQERAQERAQDEIAILARIGDNYPRGWLDDLRDAGFFVGGVRNVGGRQDQRTFYAYVDADTRVDTDPARHFAALGLPVPMELNGYVNSTPGQNDPVRYEPLAVTPEDFDALCAAYGAACPERDLSGPTAGLHIAPISIRTQEHLPAAARQHGVQVVSVDPGERTMVPALREHVELVLGQIDIFMPSDQEVSSFFPDNKIDLDIAECARWFAERGPRIVVIKLGSDGAYVYQRERAGKRAWHVPALPVKPVDVTGAGDSFCGGFMADYLRYGDPVRAAITGTVSASLALQDYGALHMLDVPETEIDHRAAWLRGLVREV